MWAFALRRLIHLIQFSILYPPILSFLREPYYELLINSSCSSNLPVVGLASLQVLLWQIIKWKCHAQVSFMFEQATTHFGAIELLAEYFSSTRKNYIPLSCQVSCMHRETYHKIPRFSDCGWPPTIISEGESLRVQAALEATIPALYCLLWTSIC